MKRYLIERLWKSSQNGGVALMLLVILGMVAVIAGSTILYVDRQFNQTVQREQEEEAFHVAEAGVNVVIFGLNESIYTTEQLANLGSLSGTIEGSGNYTLTLSRVPGALPGQNIRVLAKGYDAGGGFCEGLDVVIHRTDQARQQFVPDQWDHLPSCDLIDTLNQPGGTVAPPVSCTMDSDCPSNSCNLATGTCDPTCSSDSECPSGECFESYGMCARECTQDSDCISNSCDVGTGICNICTGPGCPSPLPSATPTPTPTTSGGGAGGGGTPTPSPTKQACTSDSECPSGKCGILPGDSVGTCDDPCDNNIDCPSGACIIPYSISSGGGSGPSGSAGYCGRSCSVSGQCPSNSCNPLTGMCDAQCNVDDDCPAGQGCNNGACGPFICLPDCQPVGYPTCGPCYYSAPLGSCVQVCIDIDEIQTHDPRPECQNVSSDTCWPVPSVQACGPCPTPTPDPNATPTPLPSASPTPTPTPSATPSVCDVDRFCEPAQGETTANCPSDCFCGDGICEATEVGVCSIDCGGGSTPSPTVTPTVTPTPTSS